LFVGDTNIFIVFWTDDGGRYTKFASASNTREMTNAGGMGGLLEMYVTGHDLPNFGRPHSTGFRGFGFSLTITGKFTMN